MMLLEDAAAFTRTSLHCSILFRAVRLRVPAMVLRATMGEGENVVEVTASEISEASAHSLLQNCPPQFHPKQMHRNLMETAKNGKRFDYTSTGASPGDVAYNSQDEGVEIRSASDRLCLQGGCG